MAYVVHLSIVRTVYRIQIILRVQKTAVTFIGVAQLTPQVVSELKSLSTIYDKYQFDLQQFHVNYCWYSQ